MDQKHFYLLFWRNKQHIWTCCVSSVSCVRAPSVRCQCVCTGNRGVSVLSVRCEALCSISQHHFLSQSTAVYCISTLAHISNFHIVELSFLILEALCEMESCSGAAAATRRAFLSAEDEGVACQIKPPLSARRDKPLPVSSVQQYYNSVKVIFVHVL